MSAAEANAAEANPTGMGEGQNRLYQPPEITPELVRAVADRVFAMLQRELAIEHERKQPCPRRSPQPKGRQA